MGLLAEPVATRSHAAWSNVATRYGCFCVQRRTEEGEAKNMKLRHRWFYAAEDLFPYRIIYTTHLIDLHKLPHGQQQQQQQPSLATATTTTASSALVGAAEAAATAVYDTGAGIGASLAQWWNSGSGDARPSESPELHPPAASIRCASPTGGTDAPQRWTVATATQLGSILEAWGLLLAAWEPEEAELRAPYPAALTFAVRWARTYARIRAVRAETGMDRGSGATTSFNTPHTQPLTTPDLSLTSSSLRLSPHDEEQNEDGGGSGGGRGSSRVRHGRPLMRWRVSPSESLARAATRPGAPSTRALAWTASLHDGRLLLRLADLWSWRDPQLTLCCLLALLHLYRDSAAASAAHCYLIERRGRACSATTAANFWWGAPVAVVLAFAIPWTEEQQRRVITLCDRDTLRSLHDLLQPAPSEVEAAKSVFDGSTALGAEGLVGGVGELLWAYRGPVVGSLLLHVMGAALSWHAVVVVVLWPLLLFTLVFTALRRVAACVRGDAR
ncbi:hypothetical protein NESM_000126000 [Novymonas esmeraldas]|uniref:ABC transmembrane type-1 domain-containing protein n=1 Tax=Novymonas esmeraldas TaxID=1808958 RepID=A0AAW0F694_9TRYP